MWQKLDFELPSQLTGNLHGPFSRIPVFFDNSSSLICRTIGLTYRQQKATGTEYHTGNLPTLHAPIIMHSQWVNGIIPLCQCMFTNPTTSGSFSPTLPPQILIITSQRYIKLPSTILCSNNINK